MDSQLKSYLEKNKINYELYNHSPVFTAEESKKIKTNIPGLGTKSLFLKDENAQFYLICLPGEKRLNTKIIKKKFSIKELQFASSAELKEELNVSPGSVSLFCMIHAKKTTLILSKEIWLSHLSGFHPNINTATIVLSHENLKNLYNSLKAEKYIIEL
ncbi:hypothetical protein HYV50_05885 [Candidatus Pacearchaeota archaeon]|nr:hypothetical protein [Candidatus Pacearchaeota archaeon]